MKVVRTLRSQYTNLRAFRAFFSPARIVRDGLRLPADLLRRGGLRPFPLVVDVNVTNRCNLSCEFCFNRDNETPAPDELTFDELAALIEEARPFGAGFFFSGGEPLLRRDLVPLIELASSRGLPVGLVTNGTRLDPSAAERLLRAGCDSIVVSVHGAAKVHDDIVGQPGSHARAMAAVRHLAARMPAPGPIINCVVTEEALPTLARFLDEAVAIRNCIVRVAYQSYATAKEDELHRRAWAERLDDAPGELLTCRKESFPPDMAARLRTLLSQRRYRHVQTRPQLSGDAIQAWHSPADGLYVPGRRCTFVGHSAVINADGRVFPCQYFAAPMGSIRQERLRDIWQGERFRRFRDVIGAGLLPGCARCCKL